MKRKGYMPSGPSARKADACGQQYCNRVRYFLAALLVVPVAQGALAGESPPDWVEIGAIFRERCIMCHSEAAAERGLRLDTYAGAIAGSEYGPVLIPGDPSSSELIRRLNGASRPRMPFLSRPLTSEAIDLIERWIEAGLPERTARRPDAGPD
jgi:mono/diheme cytochrome c family protein